MQSDSSDHQVKHYDHFLCIQNNLSINHLEQGTQEQFKTYNLIAFHWLFTTGFFLLAS